MKPSGQVASDEQRSHWPPGAMAEHVEPLQSALERHVDPRVTEAGQSPASFCEAASTSEPASAAAASIMLGSTPPSADNGPPQSHPATVAASTIAMSRRVRSTGPATRPRRGPAETTHPDTSSPGSDGRSRIGRRSPPVDTTSRDLQNRGREPESHPSSSTPRRLALESRRDSRCHRCRSRCRTPPQTLRRPRRPPNSCLRDRHRTGADACGCTDPGHPRRECRPVCRGHRPGRWVGSTGCSASFRRAVVCAGRCLSARREVRARR